LLDVRAIVEKRYRNTVFVEMNKSIGHFNREVVGHCQIIQQLTTRSPEQEKNESTEFFDSYRGGRGL